MHGYGSFKPGFKSAGATLPTTGFVGLGTFWMVVLALTAFAVASSIAILIPKKEH